jgi:hypothetical protein
MNYVFYFVLNTTIRCRTAWVLPKQFTPNLNCGFDIYPPLTPPSAVVLVPLSFVVLARCFSALGTTPADPPTTLYYTIRRRRYTILYLVVGR